MNKTISYFTIAVTRHHDEGSLWKSVLGAYDFRVVEHMTVKAWSMAAGKEEVQRCRILRNNQKTVSHNSVSHLKVQNVP